MACRRPSQELKSPTTLTARAAGARYKYEILTQDHQILLKADPYAFETEVPPKTASVVFEPRHSWSAGDADWLRERPQAAPALERPVSIYEVHLGRGDSIRSRATAR